MKTIKIIDLLKNYADGKEMPRLIRYMGDKYTYNSSVTFPHSYIGENDKLFTRGQIYLNDEVEILDEEDEFEDIKPLVLKTFERTGQAVAIDRLADYYFDNFKLIENALAKVILNQKKIIERLKEEGK